MVSNSLKCTEDLLFALAASCIQLIGLNQKDLANRRLLTDSTRSLTVVCESCFHVADATVSGAQMAEASRQRKGIFKYLIKIRRHLQYFHSFMS